MDFGTPEDAPHCGLWDTRRCRHRRDPRRPRRDPPMVPARRKSALALDVPLPERCFRSHIRAVRDACDGGRRLPPSKDDHAGRRIRDDCGPRGTWRG